MRKVETVLDSPRLHRFATKSIIRRLRISSALLILQPLPALALVVVLIWGLLEHDTEVLKLSLKLLVVNVAVFLLLVMVGFSIRCPLCRSTLIRKESCSIHPKADRSLGSIRLPIATGTLLRGHFRCPYCGEHCDTCKPRRS